MNTSVPEADLLSWHEAPWSRLAAMLDLGRLPHALMLYGPAGIGKRRLAVRLAGAILCAGPRPAPCGRCRSCHLLNAGNHPDFRRVEPGEGGSGIQIGSVRDLIEQFTLAAKRARVAVVAPAEAMNQAAANAFLKTLEEPAGSAVFILTSDAPGLVPATIRSRCRKMAIPPPSRAEALAWLTTKTETDSAARMLALAGGMPLAAFDLGRAHDEEALAALHAETAALLAGRSDPLEVAERWRKVGDGRLVTSALFAALAAAARCETADPDRLYRAVDDVVETRRRWTEVPGLAEALVYEGLALRCVGAAA